MPEVTRATFDEEIRRLLRVPRPIVRLLAFVRHLLQLLERLRHGEHVVHRRKRVFERFLTKRKRVPIRQSRGGSQSTSQQLLQRLRPQTHIDSLGTRRSSSRKPLSHFVLFECDLLFGGGERKRHRLHSKSNSIRSSNEFIFR